MQVPNGCVYSIATWHHAPIYSPCSYTLSSWHVYNILQLCIYTYQYIHILYIIINSGMSQCLPRHGQPMTGWELQSSQLCHCLLPVAFTDLYKLHLSQDWEVSFLPPHLILCPSANPSTHRSTHQLFINSSSTLHNLWIARTCASTCPKIVCFPSRCSQAYPR